MRGSKQSGHVVVSKEEQETLLNEAMLNDIGPKSERKLMISSDRSILGTAREEATEKSVKSIKTVSMI